MNRTELALTGTHSWSGFLLFGSVEQHLNLLFANWESGCQVLIHGDLICCLWRQPRRTQPPYPTFGLVQVGHDYFSFLATEDRGDKDRPAICYHRYGKLHEIPLTDLRTIELAKSFDCSFLQVTELKLHSWERKNSLETLIVPKAQNKQKIFEVTTNPGVNPLLSSHHKPPPVWWKRLLKLRQEKSRRLLTQTAHPSAVGQGFDRILNAFIAKTGLWMALSRSQRKYYENMIDLFQRNLFDEALKHAIPMSDGEGTQPSYVSWTRPKPLHELGFSPPDNGPASLVPWGGVSEQLTSTYLRALEVLKKQKKVKQAAYVLSELLNNVDGAIHYLESEQQFEMAAELAVIKQRPAAVLVRLYVLAGNTDAAISHARQHQAWEAAILQMESKYPSQAQLLRMHAARHHAHLGYYLKAIQFAKPVASASRLVERWIELGIENDSEDLPELLAEQFKLYPLSFHHPLLETWIAKPEIEYLQSFLNQLGQPSASQMAMTRLCLRVLLSNLNRLTIPENNLKVLIRDLNDPILTWDSPRRIALGHLNAIAEKVHVFEKEGFLTSSKVIDMLPLAHQKWLVSIEDSGFGQWNQRGELLGFHAIPMHRFVAGDRVHLILSLHGQSVEVRKWSTAGLSKPRPMLQIDQAALSFDNEFWVVAEDSVLVMLDTQEPQWNVLWRIDLEASIAQIAHHQSNLMLLVLFEQPEVWLYEMPTAVLRIRIPINLAGMSVLSPRTKSIILAEQKCDMLTLSATQLSNEQTKSAQIAISGQLQELICPLSIWAVCVNDTDITAHRFHASSLVFRQSFCIKNSQRLFIREDDKGFSIMNEWGYGIQFDANGHILCESQLTI